MLDFEVRDTHFETHCSRLRKLKLKVESQKLGLEIFEKDRVRAPEHQDSSRSSRPSGFPFETRSFESQCRKVERDGENIALDLKKFARKNEKSAQELENSLRSSKKRSEAQKSAQEIQKTAQELENPLRSSKIRSGAQKLAQELEKPAQNSERFGQNLDKSAEDLGESVQNLGKSDPELAKFARDIKAALKTL